MKEKCTDLCLLDKFTRTIVMYRGVATIQRDKVESYHKDTKRVFETRLRREVTVSEQLYGFTPRKSTIDEC